jgi:hypothetical protein
MIPEIEVRHRYTAACAGLRQAAAKWPSVDCGDAEGPLQAIRYWITSSAVANSVSLAVLILRAASATSGGFLS